MKRNEKQPNVSHTYLQYSYVFIFGVGDAFGCCCGFFFFGIIPFWYERTRKCSKQFLEYYAMHVGYIDWDYYIIMGYLKDVDKLIHCFQFLYMVVWWMCLRVCCVCAVHVMCMYRYLVDIFMYNVFVYNQIYMLNKGFRGWNRIIDIEHILFHFSIQFDNLNLVENGWHIQAKKSRIANFI